MTYKGGPSVHQLPAFFERIAAPIGPLSLIANGVSQCGFSDFARKC
jgi:hypothetical protein